uniref:Uncharacterized protein n=1 Tax=Timema cristinae TaxID=61476 RepID=A0A7R9D8B7_TIMCR|nr:unnamed protein product [Timema cristinae]
MVVERSLGSYLGVNSSMCRYWVDLPARFWYVLALATATSVRWLLNGFQVGPKWVAQFVIYHNQELPANSWLFSRANLAKARVYEERVLEAHTSQELRQELLKWSKEPNGRKISASIFHKLCKRLGMFVTALSRDLCVDQFLPNLLLQLIQSSRFGEKNLLNSFAQGKMTMREVRAPPNVPANILERVCAQESIVETEYYV